jgi:hypothetical protein
MTVQPKGVGALDEAIIKSQPVKPLEIQKPAHEKPIIKKEVKEIVKPVPTIPTPPVLPLKKDEVQSHLGEVVVEKGSKESTPTFKEGKGGAQAQLPDIMAQMNAVEAAPPKTTPFGGAPSISKPAMSSHISMQIP